MAEIDPKTREHLQGLCRQITVAHELDPEIQEELYGHMEDKLLAYLSGEERVSEQDAFVLVREHFGDPAVLKGLLRDAHPVAATTSLIRRLIAAFVLYLLANAVVNTTVCLISIYLGTTASPNGWWPFYFQDWIFLAPLSVVEALVLWRIFIRWQRGIDRGRRSWLLRGKPAHIAVLVLSVLAILGAVPSVSFLQAHPPIDGALPPGYLLVTFGSIAIVAAGTTLQCIAWLWWSDRRPRTRRALLWGVGTWLVYFFVPKSALFGWMSAELYFVETGWVPPPWLERELADGRSWGPLQYGEHALAHGSFDTVPWNWFYIFNAPTLSNPSFPNVLWLTAIALGIYVISRWIMSQSHRRSLDA